MWNNYPLLTVVASAPPLSLLDHNEPEPEQNEGHQTANVEWQQKQSTSPFNTVSNSQNPTINKPNNSEIDNQYQYQCHNNYCPDITIRELEIEHPTQTQPQTQTQAQPASAYPTLSKPSSSSNPNPNSEQIIVKCESDSHSPPLLAIQIPIKNVTDYPPESPTKIKKSKKGSSSSGSGIVDRCTKNEEKELIYYALKADSCLCCRSQIALSVIFMLLLIESMLSLLILCYYQYHKTGSTGTGNNNNTNNSRQTLLLSYYAQQLSNDRCFNYLSMLLISLFSIVGLYAVLYYKRKALQLCLMIGWVLLLWSVVVTTIDVLPMKANTTKNTGYGSRNGNNYNRQQKNNRLAKTFVQVLLISWILRNVYSILKIVNSVKS